MIRKLTSGLAGRPAGSKPRDKGRLGRPSDPTGRNASEVRVGLERVDADADPSFARGRPRGQGSNRRMHLFDLPGYWTQHVGRVMRVIEGGPLRTRVAASPSPRAAVRAGVGQGHGVCLAAGVSGGLKSHSVRGPGPISEGGGNASPARVDGRYGEASEARRRKPGHG